MKWALITDLHANRQALEAVLLDARAKGADQFALLGDFVGYGPDPAWVIDRVAELQAAGAVAVQGNHDAAVAAGSSPHMHPDARAVIDWTRAQLQPEQLALLSHLPMSESRRCADADCLFVHANAFRPAEWDYISGRSEAMRSLQASSARFQFCGHMHEPMLYNLTGTGKAGEFKPVPGVPIPLPQHRQWLAIAGSCGQPRDGNPAACYALFEPGGTAAADARLSFERVPYDVEATAAALRASALPGALAERLAQRLLKGE